VLQQIKALYDTEPKYYAPTSTNEIDFIVQDGMDIIPIEVKAGESVTSASFKSYIKEHKPEKAVRLSKLGYEINDSFVNLPLYLANKMHELI
jgi:predicted AAA+ superfamily ATPase